MPEIDIALQRLRQQRLTGPQFHTPAEMAEWFGAVQAQDYLGALWAFGLRIRGATETSIEQAIADRSIVRITILRGTIHFLPAADVCWMLSLLRPRLLMLLRNGQRYQRQEIDEETVAKSQAVFARVLEGGAQLTREELAAALQQAGIDVGGSRFMPFLHRAQVDGLICHAARRGKQFTFALLDEWSPGGRSLSPDEALAELTRRYFTGHGPATLEDFAWWSGLTKAQARTGFDMVHSQLASETVAGQAYYLSPDAPTPLEPPGIAHLLPTYDEYLVAYVDRGAVLGGLHNAAWPRGNVLFSSSIAVDGHIVGHWRRTLSRRSVAVETTPIILITDADRTCIADAVRRYSDFLGLPLV
jgi:hypothetical protein